MPKPQMTIPDEIVALYDKLVALFPEVERKGATMPYTSLDGNMFSFLSSTGVMALRLPADQRDLFLAKYRTTLFEQAGTVLKEYVVVPASLFERTPVLRAYFAASLAYARTLKPKPSRKAAAKTPAGTTAAAGGATRSATTPPAKAKAAKTSGRRRR